MIVMAWNIRWLNDPSKVVIRSNKVDVCAVFETRVKKGKEKIRRQLSTKWVWYAN